ncbi:hypothetical protein A2U01_0104346, partial [Trifolium medium]|nr:hypothetical protein [Trifolium medium]
YPEPWFALRTREDDGVRTITTAVTMEQIHELIREKWDRCNRRRGRPRGRVQYYHEEEKSEKKLT